MTGRRRRDEAGSTAVLLIGLMIVVVMLVGVVTDASAAYLRRQGLDNLADGAALAAADGIREEQVYEGGLGKRAQLDPAVAHAYVAEHVRGSGGAASYPGLRWRVSATSERVVVQMSAPLELPFPVPGVEARPTISATAAAFVVVSD